MTSTHLASIKPFEYSRIHSCLLAGRNPLTIDDVRLLVAEGVTHILDLREPVEWLAPRLGEEALAEIERHGLVRRHVRIADGGVPSMEDFDQCIAFLAASLHDPHAQVYVHCRAGMERTAAILIAWYAHQGSLSYERALRQLQLKRPALAPLPGQEQATRLWLEYQGTA